MELATSGYVIFDTNFEPGATHDQLSNQQEYFHNVLLTGQSAVEAFQAQFRKNLSYMREHNFHSAVMSAENLINHWTKAHNWFAPFRDECNWKIIAYVRNQPNYLISAWKEWGYWRLNFEEHIAGEINIADWLVSLETWDNTFGTQNIYLGVLEKTYLVDGLLHHDFAHAIGTPHITANDSDLLHANPSINNRTALLFSHIRQHFMQRNPDITALPISTTANDSSDVHHSRIQQDLKNNRKLNSMFHFKQLVVSRAPISGTRESDSPLSIVNQEILDTIHTRFAESNRQLVTRYRPDIDPNIAFPRVIYNEKIAVSDDELIMHGFHIAFESLNSINKELKIRDNLPQQVAIIDKELAILSNEITKLDDV
ncbi:MAG: hypothetical protein FJ040_07475 [Chloroflexi bacterium]|nr:hypothetical protein [Chloroflexota bacterium]